MFTKKKIILTLLAIIFAFVGGWLFLKNAQTKFAINKTKNGDVKLKIDDNQYDAIKHENYNLYSAFNGSDNKKLFFFDKNEHTRQMAQSLKEKAVFVSSIKEGVLDKKKIFYTDIKTKSSFESFFSFDVSSLDNNLIYKNFFYLENFELDYRYIREFPLYNQSNNFRNIKKIFEGKKDFFDVFDMNSFAKACLVALKNNDNSILRMKNLFFYYSPISDKIEPAYLFFDKVEKLEKNQYGEFLLKSKIFKLLSVVEKQRLEEEIKRLISKDDFKGKFLITEEKSENSPKKDFIKASHIQDGYIGFIKVKNYQKEPIKIISVERKKLLYEVSSQKIMLEGESITLSQGQEKTIPFNWLRMSAPYVNFKFVNSKKLGQVKVKPSFEDFEYKKYPYLFKCKSCLIKKKNKKILKDGVYKIDGVVEVPKDMVLELQAGVKLLFSYRGGIDVKGKLVAKGKKNKKIIFDADPDSSNYNLWQIFQISKGGQASFEHAEIKNINGSENANSSAINVDNAGLRFQNSVIKNVQGKSAIFSKDSKIIVKNSKIENTEEAFLYSIGSDVFIKNTKFKHCARKTADVLIKQRKSNIKLEKIENISYARKIME